MRSPGECIYPLMDPESDIQTESHTQEDNNCDQELEKRKLSEVLTPLPAKKKKTKRHKRKVQVPVLNDKSRPGQTFRINHIRDFIVNNISNQNHPCPIAINKKDLLSQLVVVVVNGFEQNDPTSYPLDKFQVMHKLLLPGDNRGVVSEKRCIVEVKDLEKNNVPDKPTSVELSHLLLTPQELATYEYPYSAKSGFYTTRPLGDNNNKSNAYALDCEFVGGQTKDLLARISLVDFTNNVVLDEFIKPSEPVKDYRTGVSGITKEISDNATTELVEIQQKLLRSISSDDILIGHSLHHDLEVLKLAHNKIIDTAVCYKDPGLHSKRPSLKHLAMQHLKRNIQNLNVDGHSSVEDAIACMDLVKLKLAKGVSFGTNSTLSSIFQMEMALPEPQFCVIDRDLSPWGIPSTTRHDTHQIKVNDNQQAIKSYKDTKKSGLVYIALQATSKKKTLAEQIDLLRESMPSKACLVLIGRPTQSPEFTRLLDKNQSFRKLKKEALDVNSIPNEKHFTESDAEKFKVALREAKSAIVGFEIKK